MALAYGVVLGAEDRRRRSAAEENAAFSFALALGLLGRGRRKVQGGTRVKALV